MTDVLKVTNLTTGYIKRKVLEDVNITIKENRIHLLIGPNGAGKSTLLKTIAGYLKPWKGSIYLFNKKLNGTPPEQRARMGIGYFFQGGEVFPMLSIQENLEIAGTGFKNLKSRIEETYRIFPELKKIRNRRAGLLSGGEKHLLALGMIFLRRPKVLLLDEPSAGLSPKLVNNMMRRIKQIKEVLKSCVLMVEQNINEGLKIADTVYLMKTGRIVEETTAKRASEEKLLEKLFFE